MINYNDQLIKVSQLYYLEGLNQSEISREMDIHRTTISKMLKEARDKEIIKISINTSLSENNKTATQIEKKYALKKAIIVPTTYGMSFLQKNQIIVSESLDYLDSIIKDKMTLGFSWGRAMYTLSNNFSNLHAKNIVCVPLIGGPSGRVDSDYHVNNITYQVSRELNGKSYLIDAPAFPENKIVRESLVNDQNNKDIINLWQDIDIAFFGIGSPMLKKDTQWQEFYGQDVFDRISEEDIAGDIVSRFFDYSGKHVKNPLDDIVIGIEPEDLKKIEYKVVIAESKDKANAVKAALQGGYINVLLTTQEIANELV